MSKQFWNAMVANPVVFGAYFFIANGALAAPPLPEETTFEQETLTPSVELTANSDAQLSSRSREEFPWSHGTIETLKSPLDLANTSLAQSLPVDESTPLDSTNTLEQINFYSTGEQVNDTDDPMQQVTNVSQLRDVLPGDWAYEALRSLVERFGCIAGYPDGTFRGNRATSRYEFAAGLNACLNQIERLIAGGTQVTREEFETLQRLVQEFQTELTTLGTRLDNLEGRVAFLEDHQFSTTVKLTGSVDFGLIDAWGDNRAVPSGQ
ncbi:MAG TPA: iron uptake porin, partial [Coleofasciculaceae cyanobacterium]